MHGGQSCLIGWTHSVCSCRQWQSDWREGHFAQTGCFLMMRVLRRARCLCVLQSCSVARALIDRMKACKSILTHLADSITGHCGDGSEFNHDGTVGYALEQKPEVLNRISF
jgi:hypothetical protein